MMTNGLSVVQKCAACGKDSPEAATICRYCQTRFDAPFEDFFESEDHLPPVSPGPSVPQRVFVPIVPGPSSSQLLFAEVAVPKSSGTKALMVVTVLAGLGTASVGLALLTKDSLGLGLICSACFLGILTRVIQARLHHRVLLHALTKR